MAAEPVRFPSDPFRFRSAPDPARDPARGTSIIIIKKIASKQDLSILFFSMNLLNIAKVQDFFSFKKPVSFFWVELDSKLPSNFGSGGTLKRPAPQL